MVPDEQFLTVCQVLKMIQNAMDQKIPFSLVRVGDGENLILAQESVMPIKEVLKKKWAKKANRGEKGVYLPNLTLRNQMVEAIKKADVVGIPFLTNDPIKAEHNIKRPLTEAAFDYYSIHPRHVCHTFVNRVLAQKREFWNLLKGKRVLLVGGWAEQVRKILMLEPYGLDNILTIPFFHNKEMETTIHNISKLSNQFDIALVSCGVNAVVLSQHIAEKTGKVAIDFGKNLMFIVQQKAGLEHSSRDAHEGLIP
ncbi:GT-D fold domain-containing glycosyltransferase [Ammoniphilus sp. YIM 78166]|uniref:GT-D fold domain-containing glycosyltransferase n=1 Tax=Ammoniphilus sp. YIM 78166 TaxID=1644106 RepID=UPI00106F72D2|nr:GT-D fold domain-containing glycosyltransferase [Ammoniphilus sp. YIM 78166]